MGRERSAGVVPRAREDECRQVEGLVRYLAGQQIHDRGKRECLLDLQPLAGTQASQRVGVGQGVRLGSVEHHRTERIVEKDSLALEPGTLREDIGVAGWFPAQRQVAPDGDADIRRLFRLCRPGSQQDQAARGLARPVAPQD